MKNLFLQNTSLRSRSLPFIKEVALKSGGFLVIEQTEALVSIDVNSGKSTKKNSIEETAFHTNLEAAEEVARQLRLRDMGGLIVVDFIDMKERRHKADITKTMKKYLKTDKAKTKVGGITAFGLLEMSGFVPYKEDREVLN